MRSRWYEGPLAALALTTIGDVDGDVDQVRITSTAVVAMRATGGTPKAYAHTVGADGLPPGVALEATVVDLVRAIARGVPIVAFDIARTLAVLESECLRAQALTLIGPRDTAPAAICTRLLDRTVRPAAGPRSMAETFAHWGHPIDGPVNATAIALASAKTALEVARQHPRIVGADLRELQAHQRAWHSAQYRARANRLTRMANRTEQGDDTLKLRAQAEQAELEAAHWPLLHLPDQQGVLA